MNTGEEICFAFLWPDLPAIPWHRRDPTEYFVDSSQSSVKDEEYLVDKSVQLWTAQLHKKQL